MIKFLRMAPRFNYIPKFHVGQIGPIAPSPQIQQKMDALEQNQPFFDRLIFFDPDIMASLPGPLQVFDPVVDFGSGILTYLHDCHIPWVGVLSLTCIIARSTLLPLIYLQMKRTTRLATVIPAIAQMKRLIDKTNYSKTKKLITLTRLSYKIVHSQRLKWMRLFLYNVFHIPMLITLIWSIRRLLIDESFKTTAFLWIPSLSNMDPYFIVPSLTVICYYYNLQRFITPENKDTIPSKLRNVGQFLLILWLPFLANWPCAIQIYMLFNAFFSIIQTSIMLHPEFQKMVDPKIFLYQMIIRMIEYDKNTSLSLIEAIKSGEETNIEKAISEEQLLDQFQKSLIELNEGELQEDAAKISKDKPNFY
ncbi:unnamed protein product [Paramecium pentaurelia]|uniref:Membrane insertase YidC/Oxa/ALB C-terminal domain-containing protein n=1 Tax=Paramecium pentaurelia TaxID=43138 RepID=A0A8S1WU10_9CILI|nr:unnamed protein product [Paramecium pentaurelia]